MTTTNDLYQAAANNMENGHGVAKHTLANGDVLICSVCKVAGRSVVKGHYRTNFLLKLATAQYSKDISRARAIDLLKGE